MSSTNKFKGLSRPSGALLRYRHLNSEKGRSSASIATTGDRSALSPPSKSSISVTSCAKSTDPMGGDLGKTNMRRDDDALDRSNTHCRIYQASSTQDQLSSSCLISCSRPSMCISRDGSSRCSRYPMPVSSGPRHSTIIGTPPSTKSAKSLFPSWPNRWGNATYVWSISWQSGTSLITPRSRSLHDALLRPRVRFDDQVACSYVGDDDGDEAKPMHLRPINGSDVSDTAIRLCQKGGP